MFVHNMALKFKKKIDNRVKILSSLYKIDILQNINTKKKKKKIKTKILFTTSILNKHRIYDHNRSDNFDFSKREESFIHSYLIEIG